MIDEILVSVSPGETRIACRAGGKAVELHRFLHGRTALAGHVYLGRIARVVPGMGAAFVEIGAPKAGFLPLPRDPAARAGLHEGARVLVQITREPERGKGAQLSIEFRLPGRLLVYAPKGNCVHVARRIGTDDAEVQRLAALVSSFARADEGWIVRTAAAGAFRSELEKEAEALRAEWRSAELTGRDAVPPALVYGAPSPIARVLRDKYGTHVNRIVIDDRSAFAVAEDFLGTHAPEAGAHLSLYRERIPLFEAEGVEEEFESLLQRRVPLPCGGTLMIEHTEALWAIDVNTARNIAGSSVEASILATNLEAAAEVARQIRLRDLAGLIVVDFVHMDDALMRDRVRDALKSALADDPSPVRMAGFSDLGLVELSRRRTRPPIAEDLESACPACRGEGAIRAPLATALAAVRAAAVEARLEHAPANPVRIAVAPTVVEAFGSIEGAAALDELEQRLGRSVEIVADSTLAPDRFTLL
ncbi:MAG TPA: Rne/Rng family ribonuclease [Alphaproteobacteria bacterium]|nr:Rne/Rng family ribonuclease [Alphaproteobacteria bacterium]